jgi:predicted dehydrogenase
VEIEAFLAAVLEGREPEVSGHDGLMAVEVAYRLVESGRTHLPIELGL